MAARGGMLLRVILPRALVTFGLVVMLVGCAATPEPSATATKNAAECSAAAAGIVKAADKVVTDYGQPPGGSTGTAATTGDPLTDAVAKARKIRDRLGCDPAAFGVELKKGLAAIERDGPLASAVWRRVSASLLGTARQKAGEWVLAAGENLQDVVARASEGTTVVLPAGTIDLDATLVLLEGITLRGAGRDATTIRSTASDAAMIVVTASVVRLENLTVELIGAQPASGLVAGPSASVALSGVRMAGAVAGVGGVGGAGVYLSAQGNAGSGRGTTLEITDSVFERNAWAGVAVAGGHRVSIRSATFARNGEVGLIFLDQSSGSVSGSTFTDNKVGLAATGSATPTWLASTVTGGSVGAQVDAAAAPVIDGLTIRGSTSAAVIFGGTSGGSIGGTTCDNVPYGIVISNTAAPTLGENGCTVARGPA
ncbi:MAG: hypothetical protein JWO01_436 [Microbacteriaceae bacterium]|nr:hypothetical protein [Microbacteriaceae bacterium]